MNSNTFLYKTLSLFGSLPLLLSCSTYYESRPIQEVSGSIRGITYSLPMLQLEIVTTRQVSSCTPVTLAMTSKVSERMIDDPFATFALDFSEMANGTSASLLDVKYYPGNRIKSINSTAEDKTAELVEKSFSIIFNAALARAGVPGAALENAGAKTNSSAVEPLKCSQEVIEAMEHLANHQITLQERTLKLQQSNANLQRLNLISAALNSPTKEINNELRAAMEQVQMAQASLQTLQAARKPYIEKITHLAKYNWPSADDLNSSNTSAQFAAPMALIKKWIDFSNPGKLDRDSLEQKISDITVSLLVKRVTNTDVPSGLNLSTSKGIYYRHPVPVEYSVCSGKCLSDASNASSSKVTLAPQYGRYALIPFHNKAFEDNELNVEFSENGQPSSIKFESKAAAAVKLATSLSNVATQLPSVRQSLLNEELENLKRKTALEEQAAKLKSAQDNLNISPLMEQDAANALLIAENTRLETLVSIRENEIKLAELEAGVSSSD